MIQNRIDIISLGCSKNLIDSERLMRRLEALGREVVFEPESPEGEYVVVNTCGFIGDAKEQSVNTLLELAEMKTEGRISKIVVMGCLSERYRSDLQQEIPEIDLLYGKFDWNDFVEHLESLPPVATVATVMPKAWERTLSTPPHSAYLKISEGCNRMCAFCAIPLITGRHTSRPEEEILEEVRQLVKEGVKEFNVIAQDLSSYGLDLYGEHRLAQLIDSMADIDGVEWIRLHYAYPADFPIDVLDVMARRKNVCKYLDIALQHISDNMLTAMRRHIDKEGTLKLLREIRRKVPGIVIRTTLMVGFPGETEEDFEELLEFVREQRFERMGAFAYSEEEGTYAALKLKDDVPEEVKQRRLDTLMAVQEDIAAEEAEKLVGKEIRLIVDTIDEEEDGRLVASCRSEFDSPEVDPTFAVEDIHAEEGDFIRARITESYTFDFTAQELTD